MPIAKDLASKRPIRNEKVLRDLIMSEHGALFYELWMLNQSARRWSNPSDPIVQNIAIESFLVHFRNLRDFFYPPLSAWTNPRAADDVVAFDYCESWDKAAKDWQEAVPGERDRINKQLAHISYTRPTLDPKWPISQICTAIRKSLFEFVDTLSVERREWFSVVVPKGR